jgi:ankyrin repeat protein
MLRKHKNKKAKMCMAGFHRAAARGDVVNLRRFVEEKGTDPEEADRSNANTALHYAAKNGQEEVLTYLLDTCHVDVDKTNDNYWSALFYAVHEDEFKCAEILVQHNADPNTADRSDGMTPVMEAALEGRLEMLKLLLGTKRCNLEYKTRHGRNGSHFGC